MLCDWNVQNARVAKERAQTTKTIELAIHSERTTMTKQQNNDIALESTAPPEPNEFRQSCEKIWPI